jgi:hypothetical protein
VGGALFSSSASSLSSSSCSSCKIARKFLTICNQDPKVFVNWNEVQYQCMTLKHRSSVKIKGDLTLRKCQISIPLDHSSGAMHYCYWD